MSLVRFGTVVAVLIPLVSFGHGSAAAAASDDVAMAGFFGSTGLSFKDCFKRSKAALRSLDFELRFAQNFGTNIGSVAVGEIGKHTESAVKCLAGARQGRSSFVIDVASTRPGRASELAAEILKALLPPGELQGSGESITANSTSGNFINRY